MNRDEFMAQLARLLVDLPEAERMEAIRYYNDYFDEAGPENEGKVIQELGSPGKVAASIKANLQGTGQGEFTEKGYKETTGACGDEKTGETGAKGYQGGSGWQSQGAGNGYGVQPRRRGAGSWALLIIVLIFASPVILGVGGGLLGGALGILAALLGVVIACLAGGVGLAVGGVALIVKGIFKLFTYPALGITGLGAGLICIAVGILCLMFFIWFAFRILPRVFRAVVNFVSRLIHKGKERAQG